jgi:hypothetical protein
VAQVPKHSRNLRRKSAPGAILVVQVSHLKWNLLHPSRHLLHPTRHLLHKYTLNVTLLAQVSDAGGAGLGVFGAGSHTHGAGLASAVAAKCLQVKYL